jgi:predicted enzyme related to lactoylglutathione lyase
MRKTNDRLHLDVLIQNDPIVFRFYNSAFTFEIEDGSCYTDDAEQWAFLADNIENSSIRENDEIVIGCTRNWVLFFNVESKHFKCSYKDIRMLRHEDCKDAFTQMYHILKPLDS